MNNELIIIIFRTLFVFVILFLLAKLMGKKQVSQLNLLDYIVGITMGSIAADISLDIEKDLVAGIVGLSIYGIISFFISFFSLKNISIRRFFSGIPTVLMEHGKIIESGLLKSKIDINDLEEEARSQGYFNLDDINYAIMESTGKVSFLPNTEALPATKKDMKIKVKQEGLIANVILDEEIMEHNLKPMDKDRKWLEKQLKVLGYKDTKGILLATLDNNEKLVIYNKGIYAEKDGILE